MQKRKGIYTLEQRLRLKKRLASIIIEEQLNYRKIIKKTRLVRPWMNAPAL
ncbi:13383_t:CDS:2 [Cetraspora pellucida]|uniref:13383_t:CDS:1 n=1 Tax=Cetraspora pellucida TaxID=1433469 RepID=A0A9N9CQ92_9GLOM|nr:13383_t:CDS:2 [Cetraspora pellucida]